jgi:RNA polymerase-binding transcription factor DksA
VDIIDQAQDNELRYHAQTLADMVASRTPEFGDGICRECGDPIAPERLAIRPHALHCVDCQGVVDRMNEMDRRLFA